MKLGGMATTRGLRLQSPNFEVEGIREKNGDITLVKKSRRSRHQIVQILLKIPFARGFLMYLILLQNVFNFYRTKKGLPVLGLILTVSFFISSGLRLVEESSGVAVSEIPGLDFIMFVILIWFAKYFFRPLKNLLEYHGAEHKAINKFEGKPISRIADRCGTNYLSAMFFIFLMLDILPWNLGLAYYLVGMSLTYELFMLFGDNTSLGKLFYPVTKVLVIFQLLTTNEPPEDKMELAEVTLNCLLELEQGCGRIVTT